MVLAEKLSEKVASTKPANKDLLKKKRSSRHQYNPKHWVIHGKTYDLTNFADKHPGGNYILQVGKGRDCTELFESVHALSEQKAKGHFDSILAKYEVKDVEPKYIPPQETFVWEKNGFYDTLCSRVRKHFNGGNYKATWGVYAKLAVMFTIYSLFGYYAITTGRWYIAAISGLIEMMIAFCLMHDSSHNAFSFKPTVNYLGLLYSPWIMWGNWTWLLHHAYGHHSYTGIVRKDPDVHHSDIFIRRHKDSIKLPHMKYQYYYNYIFYMVLPNQHSGQALLYQLFPFVSKNNIFGTTPLTPSPTQMFFHNAFVMGVSFVVHFILPFYFNSVFTALLLIYVHYSFMGVAYFFCVAPNHDTQSTADNHPSFKNKIDWGEHQVRTTGNHSVSNSVLDFVVTKMWGGMNYQIEHHLFPTVNHAHYHEVSEIVKKTCKDFNLPYTAESTWLDSIWSYREMIYNMGKL